MLRQDSILLDNLTANPSVLTDGLIWYRSDLDKYKVYNNGAIQDLGIEQWNPPPISLGALLSSGGTGFFINGGAGIYVSLSGSSDSTIYFNDVLEHDKIAYDSSDIRVILHARLSSDGGVGDTVKFNVEHGIIKDGDNSNTTSVIQNNQEFDVSSEVMDIDFHIPLADFTGVVDGEELMVTITRNSQGGGADTYSGNLEIIGINVIKV